VSGDFTRVTSAWVHTLPLEDQCPIELATRVPFHIEETHIINYDAYDTKPTNTETTEGSNPIQFHAKVMLLSGSPFGPADNEVEATGSTAAHLSSQLQFLVLKKDRSQLLAIGGPVDPQLDGTGDPEIDESVLIRAAMYVFRYFNSTCVAPNSTLLDN